MARRTESDRRREAYRKRVHGWVEELVSPSRSPCRGVCFRGRPTDANESRRRELTFPSTQREREEAEKKRSERARTRTHEDTSGPRMYACSCICTWSLHICVRTRRKRTYVQKKSRKRKRERENNGGKTEMKWEWEKRGRQRDRPCVCTTRRVYQATSVVTAIVPTTSPAGRQPRSIRLSSSSSWSPRSPASRRVSFSPSGGPLVSSFSLGAIPPTLLSISFLLFALEISLASHFLSPFRPQCDSATRAFTSGRKVKAQRRTSALRRGWRYTGGVVVKCARDQVWCLRVYECRCSGNTRHVL